jgi:hypothetical protein
MDLHGFDLPIFFTVFFSMLYVYLRSSASAPRNDDFEGGCTTFFTPKAGEEGTLHSRPPAKHSTTWVETVCKQNPMGSHGPAPKLPGKYGRNLNRMVLCKNRFFFLILHC